MARAATAASAPAPVHCAGCRTAIPQDYVPRAYHIERLLFCRRACFDEHGPELLKRFAVVLRHIATQHHGTSRHLASMLLSNPGKDVPLL